MLRAAVRKHQPASQERGRKDHKKTENQEHKKNRENPGRPPRGRGIKTIRCKKHQRIGARFQLTITLSWQTVNKNGRVRGQTLTLAVSPLRRPFKVCSIRNFPSMQSRSKFAPQKQSSSTKLFLTRIFRTKPLRNKYSRNKVKRDRALKNRFHLEKADYNDSIDKILDSKKFAHEIFLAKIFGPKTLKKTSAM